MNTIKSYNDFVETKVNEEAEGIMYKQKLEKIIKNSQELLKIIQDSEDLDAWVQDKITIADHSLNAILSYMSIGGEKPSDIKNSKPLFNKEN
jgi:3-methyladenine DNA glycosylase Tag